MTEPTVRARRREVFVVTALGAFMASLDLSIVNVAFPALERTFDHARAASLAWVITGYSVVFGALLVIAGRTADRLGSRRVFYAGLWVFTAGSALCGAAPSLGVLVAGRLVQGVGAAALLPASLALLLEAYPRDERSRVVALWGGVGALAVATGPSLGAALITALSWRAAFYVNVPVALAAALLGRRTLPRVREATAGANPDYPGVALLGVALSALVLAITQGPSWGWGSARVVGALALSVVMLGAFLARSARHPEPVLDLNLFRARAFSAANAATLLYTMGFFAMLLGNILFLTSVWRYSILAAGLAVTPGPLVVALVAGRAGRAATRVGFRPVLVTGLAVFAAGLAWYATRVGAAPDFLGVWLPGTLVVGLGVALTFPVLSAAAVSTLPAARLAVGGAVNQTARQIGGALGVAVLVVLVGGSGRVATSLANFDHLWWYCAVMAACALGACAFVTGPPPRPAVLTVATAEST